MSRALAIVTAILTISHSYVSAQTPTCLPGYNWTFNSLGESPCNMTIALGEVCYPGGYTLPQLGPGSLGYDTTGNNGPCDCSTVFYSLTCACAYCQNSSYIDWSEYDALCTTVYIQTFPPSIPTSIVVPHYAYLDVLTENTFNVTAAMSASGPESTPVPKSTIAASTNGATSTNPASVTSTPTASATSTPTASATSTPTTSAASTPTSVAATNNVGAIVGGVIGGIAIIAVTSGLIAFLILRRRKPLVEPRDHGPINPTIQPSYPWGRYVPGVRRADTVTHPSDCVTDDIEFEGLS